MTAPDPTAPAARPGGLHVFRLTRDFDVDIGVIATGPNAALGIYSATISPLDADVRADAIGDAEPVRVTFVDDPPEPADVPAGGRVETDPESPDYLSVVAPAGAWAAHVAAAGRDFEVLWEAEL